MILGANPEELDQLAARVSQRADAYERAHQQITYWLNRLSWQGPEAHRFRASYRSSMGPQLVDAASALRDAASSLRSQAAQQQATSSSQSGVGPTGPSLAALLGVGGLGFAGLGFGGLGFAGLVSGGLGNGGVAGAPYAVESWAEVARKLFEYEMAVLDWFEIGDLGWVARDEPAGLLFHADKLEKFGMERIAGSSASKALSSASKALGWLGAGYALATAPGDIGELSDDIGDFDWNDQDSIEQFFYSGTDLMISAGAILSVTPLAPAGLVLMSTGWTMKAGTRWLPERVDWGVDNVVWPVWDSIGRPTWDFASRNVQDGVSWCADRLYDAQKFATNDIPEIVGDFAGGVTDFAGDVAEGTGNVVRDMGETSQLMVENVVNNVAAGVKGLLNF